MRAVAAVGLALGCSLAWTAALAAAPRPAQPTRTEPVTIEARPVPLNNADADIERVGRLGYLGGFALRSAEPHFGGLSGLLLSADCRRFEAISDRGYRFEGTVVFDTDGRFRGLDAVRMAPLLGMDGRPLGGSAGQDAESLARLAKGGIVVAFEGRHRFWRYATWSARPVAVAIPPDLSAAPGNGGIEALTVLKDGRLLAIAEELEVEGGVRGWVGGLKRPWAALTLLTGSGFRPTAAATLQDGRVLVLERRMLPPAARVRLLAAGTLVEGARLAGEEIARLDGAFSVDNMEGLDACKGADGSSRILVVSDDNFSPFQRTLLLAFRLEE